MDSSTLTIIGAFITITLGINAFFLRGIFLDLNAVKIHMAKISAESDSKDRQIQEMREDIKDLYSKSHRHSNMLQRHNGIIEANRDNNNT